MSGPSASVFRIIMTLTDNERAPLQNRVDPFGQIHAVKARGGFMGNRGGCFHGPDKRLRPRRWASRQWICCVLSFKERRREVMSPGLYTELFFLDEATALAAGHRPCFECRRDEAVAFRNAFATGLGLAETPLVRAMDDFVHEARIAAITRNERALASARDLPVGAMFARAAEAFLIVEDGARRWSFEGYAPREALPADAVMLLTPRPYLAALKAGYRPHLHESAEAA